MENKSYTYKEITSQIENWEKVYQDIVDKKIDLTLFSLDYDEVIFFGCGSSYNLSQSASFITKYMLGRKSSLALPSSELLINNNIYISKNKKYLAVGFSRSGETSESISVLKLLGEKNNVISLTFSCKKDNSISKLSDYSFICRDIDEKSIVMTVSFSAMLLGYCLMLTKFLGKKEILYEFKYLIDYLNKNMSGLFDDIKSYLDREYFNSYFVLGSGFNYGLSAEADLKMKEMSQTPSYSYHLYELNHGPKSLVNENTLCLILTLNKDLFKSESIIKEILNLGSRVLIIGSKYFNITNRKNVKYLLSDSDFKNDFVKAFINIPVFQALAYLKTVKNNLDPDKPKNLSYTIKI